MALVAPERISAVGNASVAYIATGYATIGEVQPGDLMLLRISATHISTVGTVVLDQSGWTLVAGVATTVAGADPLYMKVATTETEGSQVTWSYGTSAFCQYASALLVYRYPGEVPVDAWARGVLLSNGVAPSVDATEVPGRLVCFWSSRFRASYASTDYGAPAGMSVAVSHTDPDTSPGSSNNKTGVFVCDEEIAVPGATGTRTATSSQEGVGSGSPIWDPRITVFLAAGELDVRRDRVRSAVSETIGSLMETTRVQQAEVQLDEAFFLDIELDPTVETPFVEALAPDEVIATRYAVPVSSTEHLASYRARTNLGRIADAYPQAVVTRTVDIGLGEDATLTQLLDYLVELWEGQYPWLRFEAIPDLRFPVPDDPYTDPNTGTLRLPALTIVQEPDRRLSIRQIIDDFLSLIPGALRQTSTGSIEIVPFWGPDAPSEPALVLGLEDLASIDNAKPDPTQMFNGASVQARGGAFQQDQQLNEPSFAVQTYFRRAFLDEQSVIPTDRSEFPEPDSGFFASGVLGAQTFAVLVGGNEIAVEWAATAYSAISGGSSNPNPNIPHSLITEGSSSGTINLTRGGPPVSVVVSGTVYGFQPIRYTWTFQWVAEGLQVNVQANAQGAYNHFLNEARLFASIVEFDVVGEAFVPSSVSVTGRFSLSNGDSLPGPGGTNALATSEAMYGPRELQVSTDIFPLTLVQAQQIAQALVVEHINPKTIRRFEQSWWNGYRVKPDHIGRLIELPTGEVGRVQDRAGRDDWGTSVPQLESGVAVVLTTPALDTSDSLLYDGGGFVQFDDGELAVRS